MYAINRKRLPQLLLISGAVLPALLLAQGAWPPGVQLPSSAAQLKPQASTARASRLS